MTSGASIVTALGPNDADDGDMGRQLRGMAIAAMTEIKENPLGFSVPSQSGNGGYVVATGEKEFCSCPDFEKRGGPCKHVYAVRFALRREKHGGSKPVRIVNGRTTYRQDWPAYNLAQTHEKDLFERFLRELCDTIEQPEQQVGRPRMRLADMVFSIAMKVYSTQSGRRAMTDIRRACANANLVATPSFTSVFRYLEKPQLKPVIIALIERSALPFTALEDVFALDSSGFASSTPGQWRKSKWGTEYPEQEWTKCHVMSGVLTNIVTAADVTANASNDSPFLPRFVETTARFFVVREVLADKGYLAKSNLRAIDAVGAQPFIPFKVNSVPFTKNHGKDDLWAQALRYYNLNRAEFLEHYGQRSNVETVFSMIKKKFGEPVRSRKPDARVNETLVKVLCHNICVLVQSVMEFGIAPMFLPPDFDQRQSLN